MIENPVNIFPICFFLPGSLLPPSGHPEQHMLLCSRASLKPSVGLQCLLPLTLSSLGYIYNHVSLNSSVQHRWDSTQQSPSDLWRRGAAADLQKAACSYWMYKCLCVFIEKWLMRTCRWWSSLSSLTGSSWSLLFVWVVNVLQTLVVGIQLCVMMKAFYRR